MHIQRDILWFYVLITQISIKVFGVFDLSFRHSLHSITHCQKRVALFVLHKSTNFQKWETPLLTGGVL